MRPTAPMHQPLFTVILDPAIFSTMLERTASVELLTLAKPDGEILLLILQLFSVLFLTGSNFLNALLSSILKSRLFSQGRGFMQGRLHCRKLCMGLKMGIKKHLR